MGGPKGGQLRFFTREPIPTSGKTKRLKKGLRALLINGKHGTWDVRLAPISFAIRNRQNDQTGQPPSALVFGRECKRPGDCSLFRNSSMAEEQREGSITIISGTEPGLGDTRTSAFTKGDVVYFYKTYHIERTKKISCRFRTKMVGTGKAGKASR